jgi:hypothetical protein
MKPFELEPTLGIKIVLTALCMVAGRVQERGGDGLVPVPLHFSFFGDEPSPPLFAYFLERALCIVVGVIAASYWFR